VVHPVQRGTWDWVFERRKGRALNPSKPSG